MMLKSKQTLLPLFGLELIIYMSIHTHSRTPHTKSDLVLLLNGIGTESTNYILVFHCP